MAEVPSPPVVLGERGLELWRELHLDRDRGPDERALIVEACRLVDRLDQLDDAMRGGPWLVVDDRGGGDAPLVLRVDGAVGEARRTAATLKTLISELRLQYEPGVRRGGAATPPPAEESPAEEPVQEGDPVDELRARREGRRPDAAG